MASSFRVAPYSGYKFHDWEFKGRGATGVIASATRDKHAETGVGELLTISKDEQKTITQAETIELLVLNSLSRQYSWNDLHRYCWYMVRETHAETVQACLDFAEIYGDLFIKGFSIDFNPRPNLAAWTNEFQLIAAHARLAEGGSHDLFSKSPAETIAASGLDEEFNKMIGDTHKPLLLQRLEEHCTVNIIDVSKPNKKPNYQLTYEHHNLAGYLWMLVARDAADQITYTLCEGCGIREVPGTSPSGQRSVYCTQKCKQKGARIRKAKGTASISIKATATATLKKGGKNNA